MRKLTLSPMSLGVRSGDLDLDAEIDKLESDLQTIFSE